MSLVGGLFENLGDKWRTRYTGRYGKGTSVFIFWGVVFFLCVFLDSLFVRVEREDAMADARGVVLQPIHSIFQSILFFNEKLPTPRF